MLLGDWVLSGASIFERPADVSTDVKKGMPFTVMSMPGNACCCTLQYLNVVG